MYILSVFPHGSSIKDKAPLFFTMLDSTAWKIEVIKAIPVMPRQACKLERMQAIQDIIGLLTMKIAFYDIIQTLVFRIQLLCQPLAFFHAILRGQLDSLVKKKKAASLAHQKPTEARQASPCRGLLLAAMTLKVFFLFFMGQNFPECQL